MNLFSRFLNLLPQEPELVGTVTAELSTGRYLITFEGGGQMQARSAVAYADGTKVYVKGNSILGVASTLTLVSYDI